MAVIYDTTLVPSKLELLATWLPAQPWYRGGTQPALSRAGGFRLDDPAGEVGIEIMVVTDASGDEPASYLTPLTYRGAPFADAEDHLIGTTEHGVLGRRWVYDGVHDPVCVDQMLALVRGDVEAQARDDSNTTDATVSRDLSVRGDFDMSEAMHIVSGSASTDVSGLTLSGRKVVLHIVRVLHDSGGEPHDEESIGEIVANWTALDGQMHRGRIAFLTQA
jgi:Maltokinase N-terminal cap domain